MLSLERDPRGTRYRVAGGSPRRCSHSSGKLLTGSRVASDRLFSSLATMVRLSLANGTTPRMVKGLNTLMNQGYLDDWVFAQERLTIAFRDGVRSGDLF